MKVFFKTLNIFDIFKFRKRISRVQQRRVYCCSTDDSTFEFPTNSFLCQDVNLINIYKLLKEF